MFRDKKDKGSQSIHEFLQGNKGGYDYDWAEYYRPRRKGNYGWGTPPGGDRSGRKTIYRVMAVIAILTVLFAVKEFNHPVSEDIRVGLRYVLTTDWNVRPAMEKAVKFGLQLAGVDTHLDSGMPQEGMVKEAMSKPAVAGKMLIPVSGKVVREFGLNKDPMDNMDRFHHGVDIAASPGTLVKSAIAGKVIKIGTDVQHGRYILMDHGDGIYTLYAGIGNIKVVEGQTVKAGEVIGDVARTGDVKGGGLHFELREGGNLVNPLERLDMTVGR
ncbi:MAG: murein hydrolase activator EnvC family protein [Bacillota bacterium]